MPWTTGCAVSRSGRTITSRSRSPFRSSWLASRPWRAAGPRAPPPPPPSPPRVADLEVDVAARQVRRGGRPVTLSAKEFALLELFVTHAGQVLDRATITAHVWDDNHDPFTNVLEVLVRRLRRKIDDR